MLASALYFPSCSHGARARFDLRSLLLPPTRTNRLCLVTITAFSRQRSRGTKFHEVVNHCFQPCAPPRLRSSRFQCQIIMQPFTAQQRARIVQCFYECGKSPVATQTKLRQRCGAEMLPASSTITRLVQKLEATGSTADGPNRTRTARSAEILERVRESTEEHPRLSIPHRKQQVGLFYTSLQQILRMEFRLNAYRSRRV